MSDCKPIPSDVDALIEEMNALVVMEQDAADNAQNYMLPTWEDSCISLSEFCEERGAPQKSDRCDSYSTRRGEHTCPSERIMPRLSRPEWP